jgi:hypothetical protein
LGSVFGVLEPPVVEPLVGAEPLIGVDPPFIGAVPLVVWAAASPAAPRVRAAVAAAIFKVLVIAPRL